MGLKNYSWPQSRCRGSWLHRFSIVNQFPNAVQEVCAICGKSVIFKIYDGRVDNLNYIKYHMRQVLLPGHNLFRHEYEHTNR